MRAVPPGGWRFLDDGNWIVAHSYESLIDAIVHDRAINQRPIGDPPDEFRKYVTKNWPHFASSASPFTSPVTTKSKNKGLRERVTQWLANRYSQRASGNTELVSDEEAERRASICSKCPHNQTPVNDCPPCVTNNNRISFTLREARQTSIQVKACEITGQDNQAAVFLPDKMLASSKSQSENLPDFCWLKS